MASKSLLFRTGSARIPVRLPPLPGSPRHPSVLVPAGDASTISRRGIRRSASEPNIIGSLSKMGSRSFSTPRIPELVEELGSPGGGMKNAGGGGNGGSGSDADRHNIGAYYREMIKSDPTNSLLLRNYAIYLHQVERDAVKAEEYYGRAILAGPGDGEVLSLYGKLIWETHRDESRAKSYFTQALQASPHDSMVMGSYAHFLWETEEQQCEDEQVEVAIGAVVGAA